MKREMKMKEHVLDMLEQMLMGNEGKRFAPKAVTVDVVEAVPGGDLDDVLEAASKHRPTEDEYEEKDYGHAEPDGDERTGAAMEGLEDADLRDDLEEMEEEEEAPRKPRSLRDFMDRC
jgi:hypothetical protein